MNWYKKLGPGLLYAGAAIGVSHLVQATRAGALYGFDLVLIILLVNLIKYPFFEASSRFVNSQKKNLLVGYYEIHPAFLLIFLIQTFFGMFIVQAAISTVTAGLLMNTFGIDLNISLVCLALYLILGILLFQNKVNLLSKIMKPIMLLLVVCTFLAFFMAIAETKPGKDLFQINFDFSKKTDLLFLAALIGWMPSPLDCSVWHSIWAVDSMKENKKSVSLKDTLFDLRFSYFLVILLAFVFLTLGALLMYAEGKSFSSGALDFSSELIGLYQKSLGSSAFIIVSIACLMTMISTTLTCWDAFARVMSEGSTLLLKKKSFLSYHFYLVLVGLGSLVLINYFSYSMKVLVDFATRLAFMVGPFVGFLTLTLMFKVKDSIFPKQLKIASCFSAFILLTAPLCLVYFL